MWYRDGMCIDRIQMLLDLAIRAKHWIEMCHNLMPKHIPIDPRLITSTFRKPHVVPIELPRFVDVADLYRKMEGREHNVDELSVSGNQQE
jgi:hypothetical protein